MSVLLDTRTELYDALTDAGIATPEGQRVAIPGVIVGPASPWVTNARTWGPQVRVAWEVMAIAGRADADGSFAMLAELLELAWAALLPLQGPRHWTSPDISAPEPRAVIGTDAQQLTAILGMQRLTVLNGGT